MVSVNQIQNGLSRYVENEWCNQMTGWKKAVVATGAGLVISKLPEAVKKLPMGLYADGEVDVDAIISEARKHINGSLPIDIPMVGTITLTASDLDTLNNYIMR